jgi:DNA-binding CsgD family transcriptional regulator
MNSWQEDRLNALLEIESEAELFEEVRQVAYEMGFEYCAYGIQMPVPVSRPTVLMHNNYSPEWQRCYQERGYLSIDPTVRHGLSSTLPVVWSDELFSSAPDLWEEARGHGLQFGWAQASRDPTGAVGMLTLARSVEQLTENELSVNYARMAWLAQYAHAGMSRLLVPRHVPESAITLTQREKEVLRWTAEGKTAGEIAQILGMSERTVNFHINNIVAKFGASNKTQAAVKAAVLGMLT